MRPIDIFSIDHIAYAVCRLKEAKKKFIELSFVFEDDKVVYLRRVDVCVGNRGER